MLDELALSNFKVQRFRAGQRGEPGPDGSGRGVASLAVAFEAGAFFRGQVDAVDLAHPEIQTGVRNITGTFSEKVNHSKGVGLSSVRHCPCFGAAVGQCDSNVTDTFPGI